MKEKLFSFFFLLFLVFVIFNCRRMDKTTAPGSPIALNCEYQTNPIGLDILHPRLSWMINDQSRGAVQAAYQILVASDMDLLAKDQGDLWESGKVISDQSHLIAYGGDPLESRKKYFWKVRTWNRDDQVSEYSLPANWEMGLLHPEDWEAEWIGSNETGRPPRSVMLRKEFEIAGDIRNARLYITGLGNYIAFINGQKVGNDVLTPGWTDYPTKVQYQTYEVNTLLKEGKNAIGVVLGNMWWSSGLGWQGGVSYSEGPLRLLAQLEIDTSVGNQQVLSDDSWMVTHSPYVENTIYHGVTYDARLEQPGWDIGDFDDSSWEQAQYIQDEGRRIVAQQGPPIRITESRQPVDIRQVKPGIYVFDFGANMVGYEKLRVQGSEGNRIQMRFAELLHDDGTVAQENLRSAKATDYYICKGEGVEEFEPHFTYHGFRYVQVEGLENEPDQSTLTGLVFYSAADPTGEFSCSSDILNAFYKNILRGQKGNMESVPTDCPQRDERLGWMGDAQMFAPTSCYNMNMANFYKKWMRDIIDCQDPEGFVHDVNPAIVVKGPSKPAWGDAVVIIPWVVHEFYGDQRIIEDNYEGMKAWVEYMRSKSVDDLYIWANEDNTWFGYGDWIAVEQSPGQPISVAYYYHSTQLLGKMAAMIGRESDAQNYKDLAARIKIAFNNKYFNEETNNYEGGTQTANLLPLAFGLVPEGHEDEVAKNIADNVLAKGKHPTTGFLGTGYILPMLSNYGYHQLAFETAIQTTYPSWGYMVENGATSVWELWNSDSEPPEGMNSRNHFALGSVGEWYYGYLAGIRPDLEKPGFKRSIIKPLPAEGLDWAKASLETSYGLLSNSWNTSGDQFRMDVIVPPNTTAELHFPVSAEKKITESGKVIYENKMISAEVDQFRLISESDREVVIEVGAGDYYFVTE
jgi:alpha-L-rhamnosidase